MLAERIERNRKWWTLAAVSASLFMVMVDTTVVNVALPTIQADLKTSVSQLEWTIDAFLVVYASLLLTGGRLADFLGRKRIFLLGLAIFTLSSLVCGLASTGELLIGGRAAQGVGAALMLPATHALIAANFEEHERGLAYGIWAGVSMFGLSLGPLVGGLLIEGLGWRWIFFVNLPFGVVAIVFGALVVRESRNAVDRRLDLPGLVTAALALFALVFGLTEGNSYGWRSATIIVTFVVAAVSFAAFIALELRQDAPLLDLSLFRDATFTTANVCALLIMLGMLSFLFFLSLYFQAVLGYSAIKAGATFLPTTLLMMLMAPVAGKTTDRIGPRWPIAVGLSLAGVGLLVLSRLDATSDFWNMLPGLAVAGIGVGLAMAPTTTTVISSVPVDKAGVGSGVVNTFRQTGGALGVAIMGAILSSHVGGGTPGGPKFADDFVSALHDGFLLAGVLVLAGGVVAAALIRRPAEELPVAAPAETALRAVASATLHAFAAPTSVRNAIPAEWALAARAAAPAVVVEDGPLAGRRFPVLADLSIGRRGTLKLQDAEVSRNHALVRAVDGTVEITDLGSLNGTFVNGERIDASTRLDDGDVIRIGATSMQLDVAEREAMPPALVIDHGPLRGQRLPVSAPLSLGREAGRVDIVLRDPDVSRLHALVRPINGACEIADAGSTNGTFVNGERIDAPTRLVDGDSIRVGDTTLRMEKPDVRTEIEAQTKLAPAVAQPSATVAGPALVVEDGPLTGKRFEVEGELLLGRADADITINDAQVSRRHARVRVVGDAVEITDDGSVNGTFVNGTRIEEPTLAAVGDVVRLGGTTLRVEGPRAQQPDAAPVDARVPQNQ